MLKGFCFKQGLVNVKCYKNVAFCVSWCVVNSVPLTWWYLKFWLRQAYFLQKTPWALPPVFPHIDTLFINEYKVISWFQTFAVFWMLYTFFWVIPRRLNFTCRRFGTLCLSHVHRRIGVEWLLSFYTYPSMKMEQTECSKTSACKIQTPGNYPEESIQHKVICLSTWYTQYWSCTTCNVAFISHLTFYSLNISKSLSLFVFKNFCVYALIVEDYYDLYSCLW